MSNSASLLSSFQTRAAELELATRVSVSSIPPEDLHDDTDHASAETVASIDNSLQERKTQELAKVKAAIKKLKNGTYGMCEECGEDIAEARLLAIPDAELCIFCAEVAHKKSQVKSNPRRGRSSSVSLEE